MYFVNLSTITKIKSNLFFVIGFFNLENFIIKFIVIEFYNFVGILINLIYLYNKYLIILFY